MKFTQIPESTFQNMQLNAGILLKNFNPADATVQNTDILGATSGGVNFTAVPSFMDLGEDIDNCPKNMMELKQLDTWEIKLGATFITVTADTAKMAIGAADSASNKITPRNDLKDTDFNDLWWVGDYSDKNGDKNGGFVAIHMMNTLSTGGFAIQTGDKAKGQFAVEFSAHYSIKKQDTVPFEVYVKAGTEEGVGG